MLLDAPGKPLRLAESSVDPGEDRVLIRVRACGLCRTDLHVRDGELAPSKLPIVLGHEVVGTVVGAAGGFEAGERVGVPWLGFTCGRCSHCAVGDENLCDEAKFHGLDLDGGFAEHMAADPRFVFRIPDPYEDLEAAPLLCAGLIGYRSLVIAGAGSRLGFYGFGAAAHILVQVALQQGREVYAFVRAGDDAGARFALSLGASWAGSSEERPPVALDAAIIFAPAGALVPAALRAVRKGGTVVCAGIHMSDIPSFPYAILRGERVIRSVANLTRRDALDFMAIAARTRIRTTVVPYPLERAEDALADLRAGRFEGAAVLVPPGRTGGTAIQ